MRIKHLILITGFSVISVTVGLLFMASSIESIQSHGFIALIKLIMFTGFLYEIIQDAKGVFNKPGNDFRLLNLQTLKEILAVNAGALTAFFISIELAHGGVIASAIVGLTGAVIFPGLAAAVYCGSFIGMASTSVFSSWTGLLTASLFSSLIYAAARPAMQGFGGKLGTIAFSGTLLSLLLTDGSLISAEIPPRDFGLLLILFSMAGAWFTYLVNVILGHGPVISSALTGLLAGLLIPSLYGRSQGETIALMVFAASFSGMSSRGRIRTGFHITVAGALTALLFIYTMPLAGGAGGKMGTIAFGAVIAVAGMDRIIRRLTRKKTHFD